jgi:hypothetical protein
VFRPCHPMGQSAASWVNSLLHESILWPMKARTLDTGPHISGAHEGTPLLDQSWYNWAPNRQEFAYGATLNFQHPAQYSFWGNFLLRCSQKQTVLLCSPCLFFCFCLPEGCSWQGIGPTAPRQL